MYSLINTVAGDGGSEANYRVVDTDYDSYAIVYDCSPFPVIKKGEVVVMTEVVKIFWNLSRVPVVVDQTAVAQ